MQVVLGTPKASVMPSSLSDALSFHGASLGREGISGVNHRNQERSAPQLQTSVEVGRVRLGANETAWDTTGTVMTLNRSVCSSHYFKYAMHVAVFHSKTLDPPRSSAGRSDETGAGLP